MRFHSFSFFLAFLPLVAALTSLLRKLAGPRAAQALILAASLFFYGFARPSYLPLLLGSILVNWALGRWIGATEDERKKRRILVVALALNVAFLCSFKYVNFFLGALPLVGLPRIAAPDWPFPLGASFFTLTQIMYLMDCYEGLIPPSSLFDHATFVSFFPYVSSGPLARAKPMVKQLREPPLSGAARDDQVAKGLFLLAMGLWKKVMFADSFGRFADLGYAKAAACSTLEAWVFSLAYTLQLYFDFSGYSDMALGMARILGFEIPKNFNAPLRSKTVTEFWQRWHISLSQFITTYLYTPILQAFSKATLRTAAVATLLSMTIAGLWHGPSWNFILFGAMHGAALVVNQVWKKRKKKLPAWLAWTLTMAFVNLAFVFFRSPDLATAWRMTVKLVPGTSSLAGREVLAGAHHLGLTTVVPPLVAGAIAAFWGKTADEIATAFQPSFRSALATSAMLLVSFVYMNSLIVKQFVYFNF